MVEENNVSSLQQHLEVGDISAWETALKLKATIGYPYSDYQYSSSIWSRRVDYDDFIKSTKSSSSVSGRYYDRDEETGYDTTIIFHEDKYFVQVEKDWEYGGGTEYNTAFFPDYLSALKFAYGVVFN